MAKIFANDDGTPRQIQRMFVNDSGTVREIKKAWVYVDGTVRNVLSRSKEFLMGGSGATAVSGVSETFSIDIPDAITSSAISDTFTATGIGAAFSTNATTEITVPRSNDISDSLGMLNFTTEINDTQSEWAVESNGRVSYSGTTRTVSNIQAMINFEVTAISPSTDNRHIALYIYEYDNAADTSGAFIEYIRTRASVIGGASEQFSSTGTYTRFSRSSDTLSFTITNGKQYSFHVLQDFTDTGSTMTIRNVTVAIPTGTSTQAAYVPDLGAGPASYSYTISNSSGTSIATGSYTIPVNNSDEDTITNNLRSAIIATANGDSNSEFENDWTNGGPEVTANFVLNARRTSTGFLGGEQWALRSGSSSSSNNVTFSAWSSWDGSSSTRILWMRDNAAASGNTLEAVSNPYSITVSGSSGSATIAASAFTAFGDSTLITLGAVLSSTGTPPETGALTIDSYALNVEDVAAVNGGWDCRIISIPTVSSSRATLVLLPGSTTPGSVTVTTAYTIENIIDDIVALTWSGVTVTKKSGTTDTVRVVGTGNTTAESLSGFAFTLSYSDENATGTLTVSQTDIHDASNTFTASDNSARHVARPLASDFDTDGSGTDASRRVYINTNTEHDFGLSIVTTANSTQNGTATVNQASNVTDGIEEVLATVVSTTNPTTSTTITSGATTDQAGALIAAASGDFTYDSATNILTTGVDTVITVTNNPVSGGLSFTEQ